MKYIKKRAWAFVLYPESAPADWLDFLQQKGVPFCVSPLHDKDLDPTGEPKKAHYHIILNYSGPTTFNSVNDLTNSLHQPIPIPLEQIKGYFRYLTHKDNPEKYQYNEQDIRCYNGFDYLDFCELSKGEVQEIICQVQKLIRDNNILEYSELLDYLLDLDLKDFHNVASNHTILFNTYITSRRNKRNYEK